jgi:hypothetical protein
VPSGADSNISGFQRFQCSTFVADGKFICDKFQLWPAASYLGGFRFESEELVKGYFYDISKTAKAKWELNIVELAGATQLGLGVLGAMALAMNIF